MYQSFISQVVAGDLKYIKITLKVLFAIFVLATYILIDLNYAHLKKKLFILYISINFYKNLLQEIVWAYSL